MYEILVIVFLVIAIAIIGLVLIQKGKGADMGASFGAGASATLFGSAGTGSFLTRTTTILGILFFIVSLALANLGGRTATTSTFGNLGDDTPAATTQSPASSVNTTNTPPAQGSDSAQPESINSTSDIPE